MFLHIFKYKVLQLTRDKNELFWMICFPILLGTFFFLAFGNLFESDEQFQVIPVAIISDNSQLAKDFVAVTDQLAKEDENQMIDIVTTDEEEALSLLESQDICGIFYASDEISLTISEDMVDASISQSILKTFLKQFESSYDAIAKISVNHPEQLADAVSALSDEISYNREISYGKGNMNVYIQYFYNLIAMACLYTALAGCQLAIQNQANLSPLGARKNISPVHKLKSVTAAFLACTMVQFFCVLISFIYLIAILKIDFGSQIPQILLTILAGCLTGVSLGFCVGSISHIKANIKEPILFAVIMFGCFLSGLMVGNMRIIVEQYCPLINRINPAALITDSFYSLSVYDTYDRFYVNLITLLVLSAVFCLTGFFAVRRNKYASL